MQKRILQAAWSVIRKPNRPEGRSIGSEILCRTVRGLFEDAEKEDRAWLRHKMNGAAVPHSAQKKVDISKREYAGVACLQVEPKQNTGDDNAVNTVLVYIHGGGFIAGSAQGFAPLTAQLAHGARVPVVSVDYRLSPEKPFPAAQDDCLTVVKAVQARYPKAKIVVGGDSAGGNLAIGVALKLAEQAAELAGVKEVDGLLLISPWVEPTADDGTMISHSGSDVFELPFLQTSFKAHMNGADSFNDQVNFLGVDLSSLPQTYTQVGGAELFLDQVVNFDLRAKQQGVDAHLEIFEAQFHDFQLFAPLLKDAREANEKLCAFIKQL